VPNGEQTTERKHFNSIKELDELIDKKQNCSESGALESHHIVLLFSRS